MSGDVLSGLYARALTTMFMWFEDAFLSGFVYQRMNDVTNIDLTPHYQFHEWTFIQQYNKPAEQRHFFVTSSKTFMYGAWAANLLHLTPEQVWFMGGERKLLLMFARK